MRQNKNFQVGDVLRFDPTHAGYESYTRWWGWGPFTVLSIDVDNGLAVEAPPHTLPDDAFLGPLGDRSSLNPDIFVLDHFLTAAKRVLKTHAKN